MKIVAGILAIIILLTSMLPVSKQMMLSPNVPQCVFSLHSHCKKANHSCSGNKKEDACPNGACNPFSICNCFPVVMTVIINAPLAYYHTAVKKIPLFDEPIYSAYNSECWHPPKMIA